MKQAKFALLACIACTVTSAQLADGQSAVPPPGPLTTIAALEVPRYMGVWYEIAKYPNRFQKQCIADTTAEYQLQASGSVRVINRCHTASGEMETAVGEARQLGASTSPKLQVRFAPAWLSLLPFVWGDYWVIDIDDAYQLVAVSEPKREYLWVLSRTPSVDAKVFDALVARLQRAGLDPKRLERSPQTQH